MKNQQAGESYAARKAMGGAFDRTERVPSDEVWERRFRAALRDWNAGRAEEDFVGMCLKLVRDAASYRDKDARTARELLHQLRELCGLPNDDPSGRYPAAVSAALAAVGLPEDPREVPW